MKKHKKTKRTHFQGSRSILASGKSLCRLSAFRTFAIYPFPFAFLSKRTHFVSELRTTISELLSKRTHFPLFSTKKHTHLRFLLTS